MTDMKNLFLSKVMIFANQLRKHAGLSASDALTYAWDYVRNNRNDLHILKATKKDGTTTTRIVLTDWNKYNSIKGTGRATKPGQRLFVDAAKHEAGLFSTVSFYEDRIQYLAA